MTIEIESPIAASDTSTASTQVSSTASPFVAQFPVSSQNFVQTLQPHIGQKTPVGKYAKPTPATAKNIQAFIEALNQYDINPSAAVVAQLNNLMKALDISAIRLQELPNDAVIFYPNPTKGKDTPLVTGAVLTWRFGLTQETGNPATYNNPVPQFFVMDPHSGQDGTPYTVTTQFLAGAKGLLSNAFNPNVATNPNYKHGPIGPGNIKRYTDPSHSNTTPFVPFGQAFYSVYPKAGWTVSHGMSGTANFQFTANNDYNGQFLKNGQASFTTLLSIAMAIAELPSGTNPTFPTNPNIIAIRSALPGYLVRNGVKAPISSSRNRNAPIRASGMIDNTDTVGHMANGVQNVFNRGTQTDHAMLIEFGAKFRTKDSHLMQIFALAQANATKWYALYDPSIHDPWQLAARFPDVYNNMTLYPNLFDPSFIKEYKLKGTNPYNKSSSAAAVEDANAMLVQMQHDLSAVDPNDIPDDLDNADQPVDSIANEVASKPLTFSAAATQLISSGQSNEHASEDEEACDECAITFIKPRL